MGDAKGGEPDLIQRCLVYCRLRPTKPNELNEKEGVYKLVELHKQIIKVGEEKTYTFDGTFNPDGTQEEIFQIVARPSVEHIIKGYNAAIMAYGQTGTGKSFTMSNFKPGQEGIIPRSAGHLFELIESTPTKTFSLSANFVQIYRDKLTDLMDEKQPKVDIRFSKEKGVELVGCTTVQIGSKEDFMAMYQEGDARRVVRPTKMNPESSRGHTALVLYIDVKPNDPNDMSRPATGKITFIDLAGYERFDKTGIKATAGNEHLVDEAKKINSSLLSLGHVVSALSSGDKHIPWRDSKLTMLLQDSIGGKSRSTIMITIGPASNHFHETTNSLGFGNRAMAIKSVAKQEVEVDFQKLAAKLQAEIDEKDAKIDSLEKTAKQREAERLNIEARSVRDTSRLRQRHADELKQLMEEGATVERIQKLLDAHEVEDSNLQEEQFEEREFVKEREEEEDRETIKTIDQQHRVRAASIKREVSQAKQKELDAAYALIAQLRGVTDIAEIAKEIAELAGTPSPSDEAGGEPEEAASPRTANHAEVAILQREIGEMKLKAEADVQKMSQTKAAHLKCANLLKEAREQNKILLKESVNVEQLQKLEGEVEELKTAKAAAHEHYTELEDKLENTRKQLYAVQAEHTALAHKQAHAEKEGKELLEKLDTVEAEKSELAAKLEAAEAEKNELGEEFNRKQREREAETEHLGAESKRQAGEFSKEIEDLQAKVAALEAQISDLEAANKALEAKIEEKEAAITEKEAEIQRGLETVREKEQELASLQEDRQEEQEAARKRERELEKACEQCRDETRTTSVQLQQEIEEMQAGTALHVSTLLEKLNLLNSQLDANRAEVEQTKASGESQAVKLDEVEQSLAQAEARLGEAERTIEAKDAEVEAAAAAIREKETEVESLQAKLDETLSRAEQGESEGKQLQELARERDQLTQQASAEAAALQAQLEERDAELQNLRAELEKEKSAGADGAAKLEETAQGATEAGARLEEASRSIAEKEASLREAAAACEAKEEELRGVAGEAETLREQLAAAAARADEAEEKGQTLQTQLQDATRQLEASQQESAVMRTQLDEQAAHLEGLRAELEKEKLAGADGAAKLEETAQGATEAGARLEEASRSIAEKEASLREAAAACEAKEEELRGVAGEAETLREQLAAAAARADEAEEKGQTLQTQLQDATRQLEASQQESAELRTQLDERVTHLEGLRAELEDALKKIEAHEVRMEEVADDLQSKEGTLQQSAEVLQSKEAELASLGAELADFKAKLDDMTSQAEASSKRGQCLDDQLQEVHQRAGEESSELQKQLEESAQQLKTVTEGFQEESVRAKELAESKQREIEDLEAQVSELAQTKQEEVEDLRCQISRLNDEIKGYTTNLKDADDRETELKKQQTADLAYAEQSKEENVRIIRDLESSKEEALQKQAELTEELRVARSAVEETSTGLKARDKEVSDAESKAEALSRRLNEAETAMATTEQQRDELSAQVVAYEEDVTAKNEHITDLVRTIESLRNEVTSLEIFQVRVPELENSIELLQQGSDELSLSLAAAEKERDDAKAALKAQSDTLRSDNERATTEITEYQEKTAGLNAELSERTAAVEAGQEKISDLEGALEDASVREAALNRELSQLREELAAKEEALAEYADREKAGEEEKGDLNRQLQAASAGKSEGDERLGALTEELSAVKEQSAAVEASLADVNRQLADTANELTAVTDRLAASEASLAEQKEGFAALQQASSGETASLLSQLATANSSLEEARGERDAVAAAKAQEVAALQQESSSLIQDRDELKAQLGKSTDDLSRLRAECEELKAKLDEQVVTTEDLAQQLKDAEESLAVAKEDLENEKAALEEAKEEHELSEAELADFKETAEADMQRLKAEKEEMEKQHTETTTSLEEELANTIQLTEALEKRIKELEDKIFELQGTLDTEKTNAQLELEGLKKKSVEERKLREEEVASGRAARDALKAQMQQELEEEKKKKTGGKFKYKSKLVSQLAGVGQVGTAPANAPAVNLRPADILASLDLEEVKASLRYKLIIVGANGTGKSSVFKCMTAEGSSLMKKLPEVLSPTPAVTCVDYVYRERKEGFLSKARSGAATYFEVWDTPCDPRVLASLPNGCLPVTGCCYVVTFLLPNDIGQEGKKMEDALRHVYASCKKMHEAARSAAAKDAVEKKRKPPGLRIAVLLVGTKRDGVSSSKDSSAVSKKIADAKRWFRDCLIAKENFSLVDCVAVSCKDWTATYDSNRTSSHSINGLVGVVAGELARLYPNTPPALLAPGTFSSGDAVEVPEWYAAVQEVHSEKQRLDVARWKSVLSLVVQLGRLRRRNVWLMGSQEYETMLSDHIPSHVVASHPNTLRQFIDAFVFRGLATPPIHDVENHPDDPRESFVIIGQTMLVRVIGAALWLPSVYLSQLDSFATEPPGYLKNVVVKSTAFNVEEVWRPDWELMFDGKYSSTAADKLLKRSKAFEKDPPLGYKFLQCLGLAFNMKYTSTPDAQICYAPCIALSSLVTDLESLFLALYKKNSDGWEAATAKSITPMSPLELLLLQKELYEANEGKNVHFWGNGVAVGRPVEGGSIRWGYVKVSGTATTVCCEGKTNNVMPYLRGLVEKFAGSGSGGRLDWFEGMSLDHLPSLPPSMVQKVAAAESFGQFVEAMPPKQTRGSTYPATALDNDLKKWGRGSKAAGSKIDASRLALFEERV
ncbi:hypothetical protein DIPPA_22195 [Diplonema papillatum]|nr:hypothetical protein DIPPA_22195 [Diplonema papillatum]